MMKTVGIAVGSVVIVAWLGGLAAAAEPLGNARGAGQFRFLQGSKWYVPAETLPAMELQLKDGRVRALVDQTSGTSPIIATAISGATPPPSSNMPPAADRLAIPPVRPW